MSNSPPQFDPLCLLSPFTSKGKGLRDFWTPHATGDYEVDYRLGELYAADILPLLRGPEASSLLRYIVCAIADHADGEKDRGVICGIFGEIEKAIQADSAKMRLLLDWRPAQ